VSNRWLTRVGVVDSAARISALRLSPFALNMRVMKILGFSGEFRAFQPKCVLSLTSPQDLRFMCSLFESMCLSVPIIPHLCLFPSTPALFVILFHLNVILISLAKYLLVIKRVEVSIVLEWTPNPAVATALIFSQPVLR